MGLALDRAGNLYAADLGNGRVRRISARGTITTVARVPAAAAVAVDPAGRQLAIASLENAVHRLDLRTGRTTLYARADNPHGLAYDRAGNLLVAEQSGLRRFDARTGASRILLRAQIFKVHVAPNGVVYLLSGSPTGGAVDRLVGGRAVRVAGTGGLALPRPTAGAAGGPASHRPRGAGRRDGVPLAVQAGHGVEAARGWPPRHAHALEASTYTSRHGPGARTAARLRAAARAETAPDRLRRRGRARGAGRDASEALDQKSRSCRRSSWRCG